MIQNHSWDRTFMAWCKLNQIPLRDIFGKAREREREREREVSTIVE